METGEKYMSHPRVRRRAAFTKEAKRMYDQLENWYDEHLQASLGEIEVEAGQVYAVEVLRPVRQVVTVNRPIQGLANISTDVYPHPHP